MNLQSYVWGVRHLHDSLTLTDSERLKRGPERDVGTLYSVCMRRWFTSRECWTGRALGCAHCSQRGRASPLNCRKPLTLSFNRSPTL